MAQVISALPSFPSLTGRSVSTGKYLLLFALGCLAFATGSSAFAGASATTTTLAITSGGSAVTTVPGKTVVTLTATVQAGSTAVKLGTVNFCDASAKSCTDIHLLGTAQLTSAGTAAMKFRPGIGSHIYKAVFLNTKSNAASTSSTAALTVTMPTGGYPTTTAIAQGGDQGDYTLTATVSGPREIASPTGTVSFLDTSNGNFVLDTATLGAGTPGFSWLNSQNFFTYGSPQSIVAADFNGDGILDFAAAGDNSVTILLGNGDGTFKYKSSVGNCGTADAVAVADFNGDGMPDLAVTCPPDGRVNIYLGNGDGTFAAKSSLSTGNWPNGVAAADFNGDGILDLAVANAPCCGTPTPYLTILLGNGDGTFTAAPNVPAPSYSWDVKVGDFNGDGIPDLVFSNTYTSNNSVIIMLGNGDGTFTAAPSVPTGGGNNGILVADFNGDGKEDLALSYGDGQGNTILKMLFGNGDGTFTAAPAGPITFPYSAGIDNLGDFNGDGIQDLAVLYNSDKTVSYLLGNGDGTFTTTAASPPLISNLQGGVAVGDFNGDGISDVAVSQYPVTVNTVAVWLTQFSQTATATASGISVVGASGTHQVEASYPGDSLHASSVSGTTALQATGPVVALSAASLAYDPTLVGAGSPSQSVTLTNTGEAPLSITSIAVTGTNASSFAFANNCGSSLAAGASCSIHGHFAPTTTGALSAAVTITDDAANSPQSIALSGTGLNSPPSFSAGSLSFGSIGSGGSSASQSVILTNTGTSPLSITSISVTGANASSFVFASNCGSILAGGANCTIHGHFAPATPGPLTAAVTITDDATGPPQSIALSGTGLPPGAVSLSASSLSFGTVRVGLGSATQTVTLTNTGGTRLTITSIVVTGADVSSFVFLNTCKTNLAAGASCSIHGHFAPATSGALTAAITITDSVTGSPQSVGLSGTGQ